MVQPAVAIMSVCPRLEGKEVTSQAHDEAPASTWEHREVLHSLAPAISTWVLQL